MNINRVGIGRSPLLIAMLLSLMPVSAIAQEERLRTLTITGQGLERIATTLTEVQLGVEIRGESATGVQQEVAQRTAAVIEAVRSRSVEQLQTTGIRLQPLYNYENDNQRLVGYVATNTISFRLPTEQVGTLLDEAVRTGATRIDGVSFTATETAITEAQQQALRLAVQDAQQQAQTVLQALNLSSKEVVSIQVGDASVPPPRPVEAARLANDAATTPVVGGEQTVRASVTLEVSY